MKEMKAFNRRKFIRSSVLGSVAAILGGRSVASAVPGLPGTGEASEGRIIYRTLGKTGVKIPVVSMGVMRADNPSLVKAALDKGILHLDTAHGYQKGRNEEMLGEVLQAYPRDKFFIATKIHVAGADRETGVFGSEANPDQLLELFEISLQRLKLDHVDILYLHGISGREGALHQPLIRNLEKLKQQGKIRFAGMSTHTRMAEVIHAAIDSRFYDVVLTSYNFQMAGDTGMSAALERAGKEGLGIVAMKTMAGGFLDRQRTKPVNTKAALKWVLQNENVCTTIPGFTSFDQLENSFSVMADLNFSVEEKAFIDEHTVTAGLFCEGCRICVENCPGKLPIPEMMRAYMYTYGYHSYDQAHDLVGSLDLPADVCGGCATCTAGCPRGLDVAARIRDVARMNQVPGEFFT